MTLRIFFQRLRALFSPLAGWEERVRARQGGCTQWPAPVEGKPKLVGFPVEWILAEPDAGSPSGLRYHSSATCTECCKAVDPVNSGVRCARCGVALHEGRCAGMRDSFDVSTCSWCRPIVAG